MYIQEIILEGFKSYATRTVISGWDSEFNAITGLNGSGKSNILDAICFVLGIENLRQVRATTLQDLVYKRGQAGITKASVTIVFNNEDPAQSPVGYSEHPQITVTRQIVVGGKNKYLVNGHTATNKVVENLFQSVQLNINNPHFLIMQGQITKVLNMKAPEILAMLEETAGTRMFEDRRLRALQTMGKKEKKVEEIEALLADVIEPKLAELRREKSEYVEYQRAEGEIEQLARFLAAFDYHNCRQEALKRTEEFMSTEADATALEEEIRETRLELERVEDQLMVAEKRRAKEAKGSHKLREQEEALRTAENELVRLQTQADLAQKSFEEEQARGAQLSSQLASDEAALRKRELAADKEKSASAGHEEAYRVLREKVAQDEELLRSLSTGLSSTSSGAASGYEQLVTAAQDRVTAAETKSQQAALRLRSVEESLSGMKDSVSKAKKESSSGSGKLEALKTEIAALEAQMAEGSQNTDAERERNLESESRRLNSSMAPLREQFDALQAAVASVRFSYTDPHPNFDRSAVKGVVAELVRLAPENARYAGALEIAAGGRLYNVVVETEKIAAALLEGGRLTRRVTIIPLDRIQARPVPDSKQRLASEMTKGRATVGLQLVTGSDDVLEAIKYVFGNSFICEDKEAAAAVAFDSRLGCKAVTVDGDVYEPSGTLSGGSAPSSQPILARLAEYAQARAQLDALEAELARVSEQLNEARASRRRLADLTQRCEQKRHELTLATRRQAQDPAGRLIQQFQAAEEEKLTLEAAMAAANVEKQEAEAELARLRKEMGEYASDRSGKLKALEATVTKGKKALATAAKQHEASETAWARTQAELSASAQRLAEAREALASNQAELDALAEGAARIRSAHLEQQTRTVGLRVKMDAELAHLRRFDEELQALGQQRQQLTSSLEQAQRELARLQGLVQAFREAVKKSNMAAEALLTAHAWIRDHEKSFGQPGSSFDFSVNIPNCRSRLATLQEQHARLRRNINFNVMDMIDRIEAKETALKQMLSTVKKDRMTIESTISKLNDYKLDALDKTFRKVNTDFGLILGDLLPGGAAFAQLQPPDGGTITDGLEIRVRLGGVWKSSLAELSGGQRSVIALALILSLLQFKPAPMYILDEVDAALDLSHTENIGRLFQTRFKGSQFIVVSLKEGMFSNANVLFRTRFRDGISSVERTQNAAPKQKEEAAGKKQKRAGIALPKKTQLTA